MYTYHFPIEWAALTQLYRVFNLNGQCVLNEGVFGSIGTHLMDCRLSMLMDLNLNGPRTKYRQRVYYFFYIKTSHVFVTNTNVTRLDYCDPS